MLVWWLVRRSGINWGRSWSAVRAANHGLLALSAVVATGMFPLRARRWKTILQPIAPELGFGPLWRATAIGVMANNVAPARAGELLRAYALSRETPVPFSSAVASVGLDRVFDGVVVLALLVAAVLDPRFPGDSAAGTSIVRAAALTAAGIVAILSLLYLLVFFPSRVIALFERATGAVFPRASARVVMTLRRFADGLGVLRSPRRFVAVLWWALLHWLVQPLAFWIAFRAFGIDAPWTMALFVQGVIVLAVAIPSSPGFVGVFEGSAIAALLVYGVDRDLAAAWALAFHVASWIPITAIGLFYLLRMGLRFSDARAPDRRP